VGDRRLQDRRIILRRRGLVERFQPPVSIDALRSAAVESVAFGERVAELQDRWREQAATAPSNASAICIDGRLRAPSRIGRSNACGYSTLRAGRRRCRRCRRRLTAAGSKLKPIEIIIACEAGRISIGGWS